MSDKFRVSGLLARQLEEQNLSLPAVLKRAGLAPAFFQQERIFVATEELFALWGAIAELSGDPAIGLKLGTESRVERYDPAAIAALHSRSFLDALQRIARYKQLTCPEQIRISSGQGECVVEFVFLLAGHRPSIHDVARQLNLSSRTLQRRLTENGLSFQRSLAQARRELARHDLAQSSIDLNETAYLLGYEDVNSFFRAFHQWEGVSPGQWRKCHRLERAA